MIETIKGQMRVELIKRYIAAKQMEVLSLVDRRAKHAWPLQNTTWFPLDARIGVVMASYNTRSVLAYTLFCLLRVLRDPRVSRIVVVDNNSSDGSRELLQGLHAAGLVDALLNRRQCYHGPALNQGIEHLRRLDSQGGSSGRPFDLIWVLDSDALVLRADILDAVLPAMQTSGACLAGDYLPAHLVDRIDGYAHPSSLFFNPAQVWQAGIAAFDRGGAPGLAMQQSLVRLGLARLNFPFMADGYVLHLGATTLRSIRDVGEKGNAYFEWAKCNFEPHYHGNPDGMRWLSEVIARVAQEMDVGDDVSLLHGLQRGGRIRLTGQATGA